LAQVCALLNAFLGITHMRQTQLTTFSLSLHFIGHFPGEPGLAGVYWIKGWWRWW